MAKLASISSTLEVHPLAGRIGAVISGVTLGGDMPPETVAAIRQAWLKHKVVFFRDQPHMDFRTQEAFSKLFGRLVPHPTIPPAEGSETAINIAYADGTTAANEWHTDESFLDAYHMAGILTPVVLPSVGGDTLWANTAAAYEAMPKPLRDLADQLWALHANTSEYNAERRHPNGVSTTYATEHPLVLVHPETGERTLMLGFHAQKIMEVSRMDSMRLFNLFQDHISRPENTVRWSWRLGDVAFWDNRATQHYGIGDFYEPRQLHRVSLLGEIQCGVDGRPSVMRRKEQFQKAVAAA